MKRFLVSPPFGNYIKHPNCTPVIGSLTLNRRPGLIWNTIKSLRPIKGGWVNQIGLRNAGLNSINKFDPDHIYSLVGLGPDDWSIMLDMLPPNLNIELNLGCPNVHEYGIPFNTLRAFAKKHTVSVKLPATSKIEIVADLAVNAQVHYLHCSNTIPTDRGGESGKRLKEFNLPMIELLHRRYRTPIIAGGGIYTAQDVTDYTNAGADHFSLSTAWFRPFRTLKLLV